MNHMNEAHAMYYNVDHSSMFGSNLSTVYADGPPPLEDINDEQEESDFKEFSSGKTSIRDEVLDGPKSNLQFDFKKNHVEKRYNSLDSVSLKNNDKESRFERNKSIDSENELSPISQTKKDLKQNEHGQFADFSNFQEESESDLTNNSVFAVGKWESDDEFGTFSSHDENFEKTYDNHNSINRNSQKSTKKQLNENAIVDTDSDFNSIDNYCVNNSSSEKMSTFHDGNYNQMKQNDLKVNMDDASYVMDSEKSLQDDFDSFKDSESSTTLPNDHVNSSDGSLVDKVNFTSNPSPKMFTSSSSADVWNEQDNFTDFGAFTTSKTDVNNEFTDYSSGDHKWSNFQADFSNFGDENVSNEKTASKDGFKLENSLSSSNSQSPSIGTSVVAGLSLHTCFPDIFFTSSVNVKQDINFAQSTKQMYVWKNLEYSMYEGVLRFFWKECDTFHKICQVLAISQNNVNSQNPVALVENNDIPMFATGLGILQPSILPLPPKKSKVISQNGNKTLNTHAVLKTSETKTENVYNGLDTLSNADTAYLNLEFFESLSMDNPVSKMEVVNPISKYSGSHIDLNDFKKMSSNQEDPINVYTKLDTSKISTFSMNYNQSCLSELAKETIDKFEDLSFMHSSVLMFPLSKNS
ncbi:aftiphilin-like isoform X2 [Xenia sp. Carnegie-2017]|uniref:aftiphilin-like isoform X2 n=1 Tax=Xenia sp. Carnegie-2017 TaxID=2897299 RepID=UPI001F04C16A|nr:aftiphilin-like isoform X2 [Xenia sp. Carnegie-2017]